MIPKINQDLESSRHQKNMTNTQKRNDSYVKEGVIVNSYVKDPLLIGEKSMLTPTPTSPLLDLPTGEEINQKENTFTLLDETCDTLVISNTRIDLPQRLDEKEEKKSNPLLPICATTLGVMGLLGSFTAMMKRFSKSKLESTKEYLLPGMTRNHCINDEVHQSIFSMIQSPNRKTILASLGVITLGSTAFLGKIFIDGFKEVWVKKQEADIQKNLQENLIAVETQSFSGKIQIIRSMLASKAKLFAEELSFKGNSSKKEPKDYTQLVLGGMTLLSILGLGYFAASNIRKSDEYLSKGIQNTQKGLDRIITEFNNKKPLNNIQGHNGEILSGERAYKHLIENLLESIYAQPAEVKATVEKLNLPEAEKAEFLKHLLDSMNQATEQVNPMIGGSGRNKITYFSHVNDYLSFFYDWLMNPKNPQFKNLFFGIAGISALAYGGKAAAEAVKEVQVKKYNAQIELDLQKRLVSTELRNFKAKKESAIEPLCDEFFKQKSNGKSPEELKVIADNILFEIKNGPPFVYS